MSDRLGSNINSPYFMTDPVKVRQNGNHLTSNHEDQSILIKGDNSREQQNDSYEHVGGENDIFIIKNNGGSFQLHRRTLKDALLDLKTQSNVSVRRLNAEHTEAFKSIVEALRLLYGSQALYDLVLNDIREIFSDVKDIIPGTIAAFFIGCFNDDKFPGPIGCSPKCAASLRPTEGTPGYTNCDDLVLIYTNGLFSSLNEKQSSHAYIYIDDPHFNGFSGENITQLKDAGIQNVSLVFGNQDGSYREVTSALPIDKLPNKGVTDNITSQSTNNDQVTTSDTTNSVAGIALAIIIIIIAILLIIVLYRNYTPW